MNKRVSIPIALIVLLASCKSRHDMQVGASSAATSQGKIATLRLSKGAMMVVQTKQGTALLEFTAFGEKRASYRWRAVSPSGRRGRGTGTVAEHYQIAARSNNTSQLVDQGSELLVGVGVGTLLWSYADLESGWLYVDQSTTVTRVVASDAFDTFTLLR